MPTGNDDRDLMALGLSGQLARAQQQGQNQAYNRKTDMLNAIPLMIIPVIFYNILALAAMASGSDPNVAYTSVTQVWFSIPMPSNGTIWNISVGDVLMLGALVCLFLELIKSTNSDQVAIVNHSLSLIVFVICLIEFLLFRPFATSVFFIISAMALLDVVAGFIVTIHSARKDIEFGGR